MVLDASAAIEEWLLQTSIGQRVEQQIFSQSESLHAPHLLDVEIIQVLRRLVRERVISAVRADQAITDLLDLRINRYPHFALLPRIGSSATTFQLTTPPMSRLPKNSAQFY